MEVVLMVFDFKRLKVTKINEKFEPEAAVYVTMYVAEAYAMWI
jgi:hypothetical protein